MWLPWRAALWCALVLALISVVVRPNGRWLRTVVDVSRESAILTLGVRGMDPPRGDLDRQCGRRPVAWSVALGFRTLAPSTERGDDPTLVPPRDLVDEVREHLLHRRPRFPLGIFLVWLFVRHRDRFAYWRNILGFVSITCALIQTIPLAPPRMYPELGFVDAGAIYGPTVYSKGASGAAGQLAAMPSMHVGWAMVIGIAAMMVSKSRWRWLGMLHAALTWFAVTVPAYHWLLDGIVATALLGLGMAIGLALRPVLARWRRAPDPHELAVLKG